MEQGYIVQESKSNIPLIKKYEDLNPNSKAQFSYRHTITFYNTTIDARNHKPWEEIWFRDIRKFQKF